MGTWIVGGVLLIVIAVATRSIIKDKKSGKCSCGCSSCGCGGCTACHTPSRSK